MEEVEFPLGVLVLQGVEPVGAQGDDLFDLTRFEALHVLFDQHLEETCLSHSPDFVAAALFVVPQDSEIDLRRLENRNKGPRDLLDAWVEGGGEPREVENLGPFALGEV